MEYKTGNSLCGCTLRQKCGVGAYGEVWLAEDSIGTRVALKIIYNRGSYSERELSGLKNYKDCNHPNLLKIRYVEITDERICCIMDAADDLNLGNGEYLPDTLANRLNKFGRMDGKEIVAMLDGLLNGLEELHKHGLVHRDIKPDNILWVNGRPTLADVGLIALDGKGSLVGTPGFMSPKLLSGKGQADTSDDFYALGKVIYCALTGLPVGEYPSIPENMTISMDASLGRALRESCKQPVRSSAEFRKLLQGKNVPTREQRTEVFRSWKILWFLVLFILLLIGFLLIRIKVLDETPPTERTVTKVVSEPVPKQEVNPKMEESSEKIQAPQRLPMQKAELFSEDEEAKLKALETVDADARKDLQNRVVKLFRELDLLPGNGGLAPVLVKYRAMPQKEILNLLLHSNRNPRLQPTAGVYPHTVKRSSPLEIELYNLIFSEYPNFDLLKLTERQNFWRQQVGTAAQIQQKMLESDPLMQTVALDAVIRNGINAILKNGRFRNQEKTELKELLQLRRELLDPVWSRQLFMGKRFKRQTKTL